MDSFFFNTINSKSKTTFLHKKHFSYIKRVDISNGLVFFDIDLKEEIEYSFIFKNLDRMVIIPSIQEGSLTIYENEINKNSLINKDTINIYCSSRQDFLINVNKSKETKIFILFIADFFLKRYLNLSQNEPIDILYSKIQEELSFECVDKQTLDALSLYIINKILNQVTQTNMQSIKYEHSVIELLIHRLSLYHIYDNNIEKEQLVLAKKAKDYLLNNFIDAPTIQQLAHRCASNESKLKTVFKKVYNQTIYSYVQKLRLEKANILLKEQVLNIGEIAKAIGYKHQGHFSKLYFETYGIYPKELLKK